MPFFLTRQVLKKLKTAAYAAVPNEANGVIINEFIVLTLPNHSRTPQTRSELRKSDLRRAVANIPYIDSMALWHSHPKGNIGPSRCDLRNRTPDIDHLVLSLVDGELVPTWY